MFRRRHTGAAQKWQRFWLAAGAKDAASLEAGYPRYWARNFWDEVWNPGTPPATWMDMKLLQEITEVTGRDILRASLQLGRGAILATCHMVFSQTIAGWVQEAEGIPVMTIAFIHAEGKEAQKWAYIQRMTEAMRALQANQVVLFAPDGCQGSSGIEMPFLGTKRVFHKGAGYLGDLTGAPVIPAAIQMRGMSGAFSLEFFPPLKISAEGQIDVVDYVRWLEALLLAEPANYKRQHTNWLAAVPRFGLQEA
jgi:lauroyl/myristoyl acyltransferase